MRLEKWGGLDKGELENGLAWDKGEFKERSQISLPLGFSRSVIVFNNFSLAPYFC